jgi:hypothetical protein
MAVLGIKGKPSALFANQLLAFLLAPLHLRIVDRRRHRAQTAAGGGCGRERGHGRGGPDRVDVGGGAGGPSTFVERSKQASSAMATTKTTTRRDRIVVMERGRRWQKDDGRHGQDGRGRVASPPLHGQQWGTSTWNFLLRRRFSTPGPVKMRSIDERTMVVVTGAANQGGERGGFAFDGNENDVVDARAQKQ